MSDNFEDVDADIAAALSGTLDSSVTDDPTSSPESDPLGISDEEGQYADYGMAVQTLKKLLSLKYQLMLTYVNYGDTLQHLARDGIYKHFQEHIEEERTHAYELAKRLSALGESAEVTLGSLTPANSVQDALLELLKMEQQAQGGWRLLRSYAGNNLSLDSFCQDSAWKDGQHADDLRRYLRSPL